MWREKGSLIALECCSSKSRETGVCTGHQLLDTTKQLNLSKSGLPLNLVNMEQEKTSGITRIPREMLKLKGSKPGQILSGRSSHNGAQSPSAGALPFNHTSPFLLCSAQDPYTPDLRFQPTLIFTVCASVPTF